MAPLSVAGFMEFHAVDTESDRLRTYCMVAGGAQIETLGRLTLHVGLWQQVGGLLARWARAIGVAFVRIPFVGSVDGGCWCRHEGRISAS